MADSERKITVINSDFTGITSQVTIIIIVIVCYYSELLRHLRVTLNTLMILHSTLRIQIYLSQLEVGNAM